MQANPIDMIPLRDIHAPNAVSWWPLSPLMWALIVLAIAGLVALGWWLYQRRRAGRFYREAMSTLASIEQQYQRDRDLRRHLCEMSHFLRRLLISRLDTSQVSRLRGENLCEFLNAILHRSGQKHLVYFSSADFRSMDKVLYRDKLDRYEVDVAGLLMSTRQLIRSLSTIKPVASMRGELRYA